MAPITLLLLSFSLLIPSSLSSHPSIPEILAQNNLPVGLLPKSVKTFQIDEGGSFQVELEGPCTARFESEVRYEANVSGTISYGKIRDLGGVSAQELFLWFPVKGIRVEEMSSGVVFFDVGVVDKQFSRSLFDTSPECHEVPEGDDGGALLEGYSAARVVSESLSGKLRYALDNNINEDAVI